jgi:hypothetical protein
MTTGLGKSETASGGGSVSSRQFNGRKIKAVTGMALAGCGVVGYYLLSNSNAMDTDWGYPAFLAAAGSFFGGAILLATLLSRNSLTSSE